MSDFIWAAALVLLFMMLLHVLGVVEGSRAVLALTRTSFDVIRSPTLPDDQKEAELQANTLKLFRRFLVLSLGGAAAVLIPLALIWVCDVLGWVSLDRVLAASLSPAFLMTSGVVALFVLLAPRATDTPNGGGSTYSGTDRLVHRLAFRTREAQLAVSGVEEGLFRGRLSDHSVRRPVFITGLPRAGTTLLLEVFAAQPEFASHRYRDMPFVLTPLLWNALSAPFQQSQAARERAHGDGVLISPDSPEAFEEVLWLCSYRPHYESHYIRPWDHRIDEEFAAFLRSHMRKVVVLRRGALATDARYVSKNNLNIARTELLRALFPDADFVVPFRDPRHQADSLLRQHRKFLALHQRDPFTAEYMRDIGHFEFGENLRPVDFDGWYDRRRSTDPLSLGFWLEYWVAAHRYLLDRSEHLHFVAYDALCRAPAPGLEALATAVGSTDVDAFRAAAGRVREPRTPDVDLGGLPDALVQGALEIHEDLQSLAIK